MKDTARLSNVTFKAVIFCLIQPMLLACQPAGVAFDSADRSVSAAISVNDVIVLQHDVIMPPNTARAYFQYGKQLASSALDRYYPWCEFEIKTLSEIPQIIYADTFVISKIVNQRSALQDGTAFTAFGSTLEEFSTVLYLQSVKQPDIFRLNCLQRRGTRMHGYLSIDDIQYALGRSFTINNK